MAAQTRKIWPLRGQESAAPKLRACDHPGCDQGGEFRAPKSRTDLQDYYWFCLPHVRAYNAAWDYYAGLRPEEIERMVRLDVTWQRPTWPLGKMSGGRFRVDPQRVKDSFGFFDEEGWPGASERAGPATAEYTAMQIMELSWPLTVEALKIRYKELCKQHHPDANGGDKGAEERFKRIGQAYKTLLESLNS